MTTNLVHRFIPNSAPGVREAMLAEIGVGSVDEIYDEIPAELRFTGTLALPREGLSEAEVARTIETILRKNRTTTDYLSFLGAGCEAHYSPALITEVIGRSEFLTAYAGIEVIDHGRFMAMFEFQSIMGDLLEMDVVGSAVYDGSTAAGDAIHMASRITGRKELLLPRVMDPDRLKVMLNYNGPWFDITYVDHDPATGALDLADLRAKLSERTAAVYIENPTYLGTIETGCAAISTLVHEHGALLIANVNPASLGVLAPPGQYDADIVCGDGQSLGLPMAGGGARLGILACRNEVRFVHSLPMLMCEILPTTVPGERAYTWHALFERIFYGERESARSYSGSSSFLMAIATAVYMALLGPAGMKELAVANMQKAAYARKRIGAIPGVKAPVFDAPHFNEFLVNFDATGRSVSEVNTALLAAGILGGKDVSKEFPHLGQSALFCVTENHTQAEIDRLVSSLAEVTK